MLAGQRLNSNRLRSQELQEYEPSEQLADDDEAPQGRRPAAAARLPDMPAQRAGSTASRSQSFDLGQRKMSGQLGTKTARRSALMWQFVERSLVYRAVNSGICPVGDGMGKIVTYLSSSMWQLRSPSGFAGPQLRSACCQGSALRASAWLRRSCQSRSLATAWLRMMSLPRNRDVALLDILQQSPQTVSTGASLQSSKHNS